ncbi:MAG: hypothetical protein AAB066_06005 [Candidatus Margulisiibacteriota bacterium]
MVELLEENTEGQPAPSRPRRRFLWILIGIIVLVGLGVFGYRFFRDQGSVPDKSGKPGVVHRRPRTIKYVRLYQNLDAAQTSAVLQELSFAKIAFNTEQRGRNYDVFVDEEYLEDAKNILAMKGLPGGGRKGYELFDQSENLGVTEFDKRVRLVRALAGELEKAIVQFESIENCKVQIVMPERRLFSTTSPLVTASVLLRRAPGHTISDELVYSIIKYVSGAVENLEPANIAVIDVEGQVLSNGLFERLARNQPKTFPAVPAVVSKPETVVNAVTTESESISDLGGDEVDLNIWRSYQKELEGALAEKATHQLAGILPEGQYKVAVAVSLKPDQDQSPVIDRMAISVVVASANTKINLGASLKTQIFQTIAGAVGYIKGRDTIQLSKADFAIPKPETVIVSEKIVVTGNAGATGSVFLKYLNVKYVGGGIVAVLILWLVVRFVRRPKSKPGSELIWGRQNQDRSTDFSKIRDELSDERHLSRLRDSVRSRPEAAASVIQKWAAQEG